jgi:dihydroxyacid dehydratase/phosphogluconate dehydratase
MDLSLFSRDTIALSTAIALSHGMFEAAALLGIVRLSAEAGELSALVAVEEWAARDEAKAPAPPLGTGRELFAFMRAGADGAEQGASAMLAAMEAEL